MIPLARVSLTIPIFPVFTLQIMFLAATILACFSSFPFPSTWRRMLLLNKQKEIIRGPEKERGRRTLNFIYIDVLIIYLKVVIDTDHHLPAVMTAPVLNLASVGFICCLRFALKLCYSRQHLHRVNTIEVFVPVDSVEVGTFQIKLIHDVSNHSIPISENCKIFSYTRVTKLMLLCVESADLYTYLTAIYGLVYTIHTVRFHIIRQKYFIL